MKNLNTENFEVCMALEKGLFLLSFSSATCGPCRSMEPVFLELEKANPKISLYKISVEESPELAAHFGVRGVPHISFCEGREVLYEFTGLTPLNDLQYVVDHIDDTHFRLYGDFKKLEKKTDWTFILSIGLIVAVFAGLFIFT